ncbi:MAG: translation initiation factor IF-3 [Bacteroides sp.]|nr:translation initiation factor IF-3 [Bacteroides sp.]
MEKKPQFTGPRRPAGGAPRPPRPAAPAPQSGRGGRKGNNDRNSKDPYVINEHIRAKEVRLVGDNVEQGIYPIDKALRIAEKMELDLIEISPNAEPPVCRILDYQKFLYQQKKRLKEQKQKAAKVVVKEIRFGPQTDDHDYNFKLKHAIGFLKEGSKVKAYVFFRGRSILFKEQGEVLLLRFANDLEEYGKVEMMPVLEGKRMIIMLSPLKAAPKKEKPAKEQKGAAPDTATKSEDAAASEEKE